MKNKIIFLAFVSLFLVACGGSDGTDSGSNGNNIYFNLNSISSSDDRCVLYDSNNDYCKIISLEKSLVCVAEQNATADDPCFQMGRVDFEDYANNLAGFVFDVTTYISYVKHIVEKAFLSLIGDNLLDRLQSLLLESFTTYLVIEKDITLGESYYPSVFLKPSQIFSSNYQPKIKVESCYNNLIFNEPCVTIHHDSNKVYKILEMDKVKLNDDRIYLFTSKENFIIPNIPENISNSSNEQNGINKTSYEVTAFGSSFSNGNKRKVRVQAIALDLSDFNNGNKE